MESTYLNVDLLKRVHDHIASVPDLVEAADGDAVAFDMGYWFVDYGIGCAARPDLETTAGPVRGRRFCGTSMCIAGTAVWLNDPEAFKDGGGAYNTRETALNLFLGPDPDTDIDGENWELLDQLFFTDKWPKCLGPADHFSERKGALFLLDTIINGGLDAFEALYDLPSMSLMDRVKS